MQVDSLPDDKAITQRAQHRIFEDGWVEPDRDSETLIPHQVICLPVFDCKQWANSMDKQPAIAYRTAYCQSQGDINL